MVNTEHFLLMLTLDELLIDPFSRIGSHIVHTEFFPHFGAHYVCIDYYHHVKAHYNSIDHFAYVGAHCVLKTSLLMLI